MGGTALGRQAARLTTPQYNIFAKHCIKALSPIFHEILYTYCPKDKVSHGDLDLLCGWTGVEPGTHVKGMDSGCIAAHGEIVEVGDRPDKENMRDLAFELCKVLRGREWIRSGWQISVGIPAGSVEGVGTVGIIGHGTEAVEAEYDPIYQVDLILLPPATLPLSHLTMGYGTTLLILSAAIRLLSPSLTLHMTHLSIRHTPYFGISPIEIYLTCNVNELCEWLGLDYQAWTRDTFDTEPDQWKWLAHVREDGILVPAWKKIARGAERPPNAGKHHQRKIVVWHAFKQWMRSESRWRKTSTSAIDDASRDNEKYGNKKEANDHQASAAVATPTLTDDTKDPLTPCSPIPIASPTSIVNPLSIASPSSAANPTPPLTPSTPSLNRNLIDVDHPKPLDRLSQAAIDKWVKADQYASILEERKQAARILAERQRGKAVASTPSGVNTPFGNPEGEQASLERVMSHLTLEG